MITVRLNAADANAAVYCDTVVLTNAIHAAIARAGHQPGAGFFNDLTFYQEYDGGKHFVQLTIVGGALTGHIAAPDAKTGTTIMQTLITQLTIKDCDVKVLD